MAGIAQCETLLALTLSSLLHLSLKNSHILNHNASVSNLSSIIFPYGNHQNRKLGINLQCPSSRAKKRTGIIGIAC